MSDPSRQNILHHTLSSAQFLSRLPVHRIVPDLGPINFSRSAYTFPLAGLLISVPSALVLYIGVASGLNALLVSIITVIVQILITGALHEDGLADVADGFWGAATRDRKLEIMRDSTIGTYGVLALICTVSLRVVLLVTLFSEVDTIWVLSAFLAFESLSRLAVLLPWTALQPVRPSGDEQKSAETSGKAKPGLSARYGVPTIATVFPTTVCALPAMILLISTADTIAVIASLLIGALFSGCMVHLANKHIGGHTGDVLGATQQLSLWGLYLGMALAI